MPQLGSPVFLLWRSYLVVLVFLCAFVVSYGQNPQPSALRVVVKDTLNLPVAGAVCSVSSSAAKEKPATATSNDEGIASFANIAPGAYTLRVAKEGFDVLTRSNISVRENGE